MKKENNSRFKYYRVLSILILLAGIILLGYMIRVEGEPGIVPLLIIIAGSVWLVVNQMKINKQNN